MSKDKTASILERRAAKKQAVLEGPRRRRAPLLAALAGVAVIAAAVGWMLLGRGQGPAPVEAVSSSAAVGSAVSLPAALFEDGKARHFEHRHENLTIRYFVLKSSDGVIRAAFDACDVCWPAGKGYYQDGDYMVCRNCGRRFASVLVNEVQGGCNPAPLKRSVQGGKVVIQVTDILEGRQYFDFS